MANVEIKSEFDLEDKIVVQRIADDPQKGIIVEIRTKLYRSITSGVCVEIQDHEYGVKLEDGSFHIVEAEHIFKDG